MQIVGPIRVHVAQEEFRFAAGFSISRFIGLDAGQSESARAFQMAQPTVQYFRPIRPAQQLNISTEGVLFPRSHVPSQPLRIELPRAPLIRGINRDILYWPCITPSTYVLHVRTLLHLNFEYESRELEESDLLNVSPQLDHGSRGTLFYFAVPGLAEKRPSVLVGDRVYCQDVITKRVFGGVVLVVEQLRVGAEFFYGSVNVTSRYNVRFTLNAFSFKMSHLALTHASNPTFLLRLFVVLVAFLFGSVLRVLVRRDVGILGLWINQAVILLIFMFDKRPEEEGSGKRMDKFTPFEVGTLVCQVIPILYVLISGQAYSYYGLVMMIVLQSVLKFGLMHALGNVVEISL